MRKNTKDRNDPQEQTKSPEEMQKYTVLLFKDVPENTTIQNILQLIKGVDILSVEKNTSTVTLTFFSYFDLFQQWSTLGSEITLDGALVKIEAEASPLPEEERDRLYLSHAAGGTRNIMLATLEDFMTGDFIREEAEKYGEIESLKYMRDRKLAYIVFFSFRSAMEFVVNVREDSLFQNVKVGFGKDRCGTGEADDVAPQNSRTVYFGNIPGDATPSEILSVVQGGRVYMMKIIREKKCAFVGFFSYISAAAFIEYSQAFSVCIRGMQVKLGPGKTQPLPPIAPVLAYKGVTRCVLVRSDRMQQGSKLESEISRYGEIEKIERKNNELWVVHYLTVQDAYTAYQAMLNDPALSHMLCGYAEDPCAEVSALDLIMEVQRKTFLE